MGHTHRQLTEAECAEEIRAICGDEPGETPEDGQTELETPTQGELL